MQEPRPPLSHGSVTLAAEHELSPSQDVELKSCANHAIAWGVVCIVGGLVALGLAAPGFLGRFATGAWKLYAFAGVLELALGINFLRAGVEFRGAVYTRGRDISHVVKGLAHLSTAVLAQIVLAGVTVAFVIVTGLILGGGR